MSKHVSPRRLRRLPLKLVVPAAALILVGTVAAAEAIGDGAPDSAKAGSPSERVVDQTLIPTQPTEPTVTPTPTPTKAAPEKPKTRPAAHKDDDKQDDKQKQARQRRLAERAEAVARELDPETTFQVASFNVLGDSHTRQGGTKPHYASGPIRTGWAVQALNQSGVDVVGFQEFESVQHHTFMRRTSGAWGTFPGTSLGKNPVRNSIAWRRDTWSALELRTIPIPYFHGNRVPMPYVLLEHNQTGQRIWLINIHNPASSQKRGFNERWRDVGTSMQVRLMNQLKADGTPVILMGDFNERAEAFCKVTSGAAALAANGGTTSPCRPPAGHGIDWIFGTPGIDFSNYARQRTPLIVRTTDHPMISATASIGGDATE